MDKIDEIGYVVWEEYYRQLTRRIHKPVNRSHNYWDDKKYKVFRQIAQICIDNDIDPADYLSANFGLLDKEHVYIRPEDFASAAALARCKQHGTTDAERSWVVQVGILTDMACRCIPKYFKDETEILSDTETPFKPWFRLIYVTPFNENLFTWFGELAWTQLREDRSLRRVARKHSTANIDELERRLGQFGDVKGVNT